MKQITVICTVFVLFVVYCLADDKYTDKFDNLNVDEILSNKRLLKNYVDCFLDRGKCTREGQELKDNILDALETKCTKCTEKQIMGVEKVIKHLANNEPEFWKDLTNKFDPDGKYRKIYAEEAKKRGINI